VAVLRKHRSLLSRREICSFTVGGNYIDFVEYFVHLGHVISSKLDDCEDIENRQCNFIGQANCNFVTLVSLIFCY